MIGGAQPEDWAKLTLLEIAMRAMAGPGFAFEAIPDGLGKMSDVVLIAAEPRSMQIIERLFTMPK